jgi:hypothetical protein
MISRRDFLKLGSVLIAGGVFKDLPTYSNRPVPPVTTRYQGADFTGWEVALGDAIYARAGEDPVSILDIETANEGAYSELRANIQGRIIMAHNITFKRVIAPQALSFIHTCSYSFRIPYLPIQDINANLNAQTLEGGVFVWDGKNTRLDHGMAFQWSLNPWNEFGNIRVWTDTNGGEWVNVGELIPDIEWHHVKMVVDFRRETSALLIDNKHYLTTFTKLPKPADWDTEVAARFQAEIVSIDPEPSGMTAMHKAEFKNWKWTWEIARDLFSRLDT